MRPHDNSFDPETIEILRLSLDDAWARLTIEQQAKTSKIVLAERILKAATDGERDPVRLRMSALGNLVAPSINGAERRFPASDEV